MVYCAVYICIMCHAIRVGVVLAASLHLPGYLLYAKNPSSMAAC